jgi:hypothetical protein
MVYLFSIKTLAILDILLVAMLCLTTTYVKGREHQMRWLGWKTFLYLLQFPNEFSRPTTLQCERCTLDFDMWLWLSFMNFQPSLGQCCSWCGGTIEWRRIVLT